MLIEAARRAEAAAKEMLALVNEGSASCEEMRRMLEVSKATVAIMSAAQTSAAASIAGRERHGDGGAEVLAESAGLSRPEAHSQVKTARVIEAVPAVRDAIQSGRVSQANAKRLAEAVEKAGAGAVRADEDLLAKAESMRPEQFRREARRWVTDRDGDGGEAEHARQRARRSLRVWDTDDGMVHLHGQFHQCMADALDNLTSSTGTGTGKPFDDICVVAHVDDDTGELIAELPDGVRLPAEVLEQLSCNAKLTGVVYDRKGKPIWRTEARRTVTEAQWQLLIARYGGCFHCGANPGICQGHHIEPASRGGPTKLDNLVPACWTCHHRIHHDGWRIHKRPDGNHTLHPPDRTHHGPAHAPERPPLLFKPAIEQAPDPPPRLAAGPAADCTPRHPAPPGAHVVPTADTMPPPEGVQRPATEPAHNLDPASDNRPLPTPGPTAARDLAESAGLSQGHIAAIAGKEIARAPPRPEAQGHSDRQERRRIAGDGPDLSDRDASRGARRQAVLRRHADHGLRRARLSRLGNDVLGDRRRLPRTHRAARSGCDRVRGDA